MLSPPYAQVSPIPHSQTAALGRTSGLVVYALVTALPSGAQTGGLLCRSRMGSELEYPECRVLGIWIKASNYVAVGGEGYIGFGDNVPLG